MNSQKCLLQIPWDVLCALSQIPFHVLTVTPTMLPGNLRLKNIQSQTLLHLVAYHAVWSLAVSFIQDCLPLNKLIFSASGRIYHQSNLNFNQCIDPRYRLSIAQRIAQTFRDPDSKVIVSSLSMHLISMIKISTSQCCSTSGCNWNEIFANSNTSPDQSSNLGTSDVVVSAVTGIILGFVVLIFCLFIFFIIFCRKEKEEDVSLNKNNKYNCQLL